MLQDSPHQPPTHWKPSPMRKPYRSTCGVPAPWSLKEQKSQRTRGKSRRRRQIPPLAARSGSLNALHLVCDVQRRKFIHVLCGSLRRMRSRTMRQGYLPASEPSSRFNQSISTVGYSTRGRLQVRACCCRRYSHSLNYATTACSES